MKNHINSVICKILLIHQKGNKGEFKNWDWHGLGKFSVPDGHHIVGEFRYNKPWETVEYNRNGEIVGKILDGAQTIKNSSQITPELEVWQGLRKVQGMQINPL